MKRVWFLLIGSVVLAPAVSIAQPYPIKPIHFITGGGLMSASVAAKARPGELNYGSGGNGSPGHLITEMFKSMTDVNIVHVPMELAKWAKVAKDAGVKAE